MQSVHLLVLLTALPYVYTAANWTNLNDDDIALAEATVLLVRRHFSKSSNTVVIVEKSVTSYWNSLNVRLLEHILANLQDTIAVQLYFGKSERQPWEYHIFIVDSSMAFRQIHWNFPKTCHERMFRFLIVLTRYTPHFMIALREIFYSCYYYRVLDVNVILNHPDHGVSMWTYKLFTDNKCRVVQPRMFFQFQDGIENLTDAFPQKLLNFHKCPIRVTARVNSPLLTFSGDIRDPSPVGNWNNLGGIDGLLIKMLARKLNFTIDLQPFPEGRTYFDEYRAYGCFAELQNGKADIAVGGFRTSDPKSCSLSASIFYHHSPVVFIVRGGREEEFISRLLRPYSAQVWIWIAVILLSSILIVYILRTVKPAIRQFIVGERNVNPLMNLFAVFLGYPITRLPGRNFARYMLMLWLLMNLILRNAYQGSLYDSIRTDRFAKLPMGYGELIKWNYRILISNKIDKSGIFPANRTIVIGDDHSFRLKVLESLAGRFATVALRDNFVSYMAKHFRNGSELRIVKEPVYLQQIAMYFPKHSIYQSAINANLRQFNYIGITRHIASKSSKDISVFKEHMKSIPLKQISNDRLFGMYKIYGVMVGLAVMVFCLELLSLHYNSLRQLIEWLIH